MTFPGDVQWAQGADNMGGLIGDIFFVPMADVDKTAVPAIGADLVITGDITLLTNKKFYAIYQTRGTSKIDDSTVGERDGRSKEVMFEFLFPGDTKEIIQFARAVQNTPGILIVKDPQGKMRILGVSVIDSSGTDVVTFDLPAYLESDTGTSGAKGGDAKGHTMIFKAESLTKALIYEGTIDVDDAT